MRLRAFMWRGYALFLGSGIDVPVHEHAAHQIAISSGGKLRHTTGDGDVIEGRGFLAPSGVPHGMRSAPAGELGLWAEPYSWEGRRLMDRYADDRVTALDDQTVDAVLAEIGADDPWSSIETPGQALAARHGLWRGLLGESRQRTTIDPRIRSAIDYFFRNRTERATIAAAAEYVGLSEAYFSRLFRENVGVPPSRYRLWLRLLAATRQLSEGRSITEAAHSAGFADAAHFTRTYRKLSGATPSRMWFESPAVDFVVCDDGWASRLSEA